MKFYLITLLIQSIKFCLELPPVFCSNNFPFLKISNDGILIIPNLSAIAGFSSTLHLYMPMLSAYSIDNSSIVGNSILHGPHHCAQKSTKTGLSELIIFSKLPSLISKVIFLPINFIKNQILYLHKFLQNLIHCVVQQISFFRVQHA